MNGFFGDLVGEVGEGEFFVGVRGV